LSGKVSAEVAKEAKTASEPDSPITASSANITIIAASDKGVAENEVKIDAGGPRTIVEIAPAISGKRINLTVQLPARSQVMIETLAGAVDVSGNFASIDVKTDTGTISTDVPDDSITYDFTWTSSQPRFLADFELADVKEGSAGKFMIR